MNYSHRERNETIHTSIESRKLPRYQESRAINEGKMKEYDITRHGNLSVQCTRDARRHSVYTPLPLPDLKTPSRANRRRTLGRLALQPRFQLSTLIDRRSYRASAHLVQRRLHGK